MSDTNKYKDFLRAKVQGAIAEANAASNLTHQGVKGTILEILISKLFRPLLPSDIGVGTGQIIEKYSGKMSTQMDIILYDKSILPPVMFDESTGIFPVEAVLYTIEVKTTLTKQDLRVAHESAKYLSSFSYLPGLENPDGSEQHHRIEKVKSIVFALNTTLTGNRLTEADRYKSIYHPDDFPYLVSICVAGDSYWFNDGRYWVYQKGEAQYDEVLSMIGGVSNTYKSVALSRNSPKLGKYIISEQGWGKGVESKDFNYIKLNCEQCSKEYVESPTFGRQSMTVNGSIKIEQRCDCGGELSSAPGVYVIENGELAENYN
ncbi:DUF6602 domain-containing protein [Vibrio chagasii]|uniref:DUF6602 domain-containing protein n=1 Tax=Vibrio chagasii TaxID=170679 RepID=UPI004068C0E1|eukprot:TRINITY_DN1567_c0_g4_i1.p3 TRINITY_DN1567_c0_g4~~TRINITY_DN1567_c0_g4_i1.p3  ORF type:complete len:318 (+),score=14.85 TRINITY_DN1567_c0_g4_i1:417-1370(+)